MFSILFSTLFFLAFPGGGGENTPRPAVQTEKVIVVQLNVEFPTQAEKCYTPTFDKKKIELTVGLDDTLNILPDFIYEEDAIEGPGCFMPQMKIIFQNYTYVVSLYCTSVMKYKNSAPYLPSSLKMKNDLEITESVLNYLKKLHRKYFGLPSNPGASVCQRFLKTDPIHDGNNDPELVPDDDDTNDTELEKDTKDPDGIFDPTVEPEETIKPVEPDPE